MMLQPTEKQIKLREKMNNAKTESEKEKAKKELIAYLKKRDEEELKDCPFAH